MYIPLGRVASLTRGPRPDVFTAVLTLADIIEAEDGEVVFGVSL